MVEAAPCSSTTGRRPTSTSTRTGLARDRPVPPRRWIIELFVLDDGWFGTRDDERARSRLVRGSPEASRTDLDGLCPKGRGPGNALRALDRPEMVSRRSPALRGSTGLGRSAWPRRPRTESRDQLVLDLSRPEIVDHLFRFSSRDVLRSAPISYVKWDMNRNITEPYSAALSAIARASSIHRYILGVYDLYDRLVTEFPEILFESCAGGGGRFDPRDPRLCAPGLDQRRHGRGGNACASSGARRSSIAELDGRPTWRPCRTIRSAGSSRSRRGRPSRSSVSWATSWTPPSSRRNERRAVAGQVDFLPSPTASCSSAGGSCRLRSPFEGGGNEAAWMAVADDRRRAVVGWYRDPQPPASPARTDPGSAGSDPAARYR